jgi:transcriptional regulator with XRE-family HTH domain
VLAIEELASLCMESDETPQPEKRGRTLKEPPMTWVGLANQTLANKRTADGSRFTKEMISTITKFSVFQGGRAPHRDPKKNVPNVEVIDAISAVLEIESPTGRTSNAVRQENDAAVDVDPKAKRLRTNLRRLRELAGYDVEGLADATRLSVDTLLRYERGEERVPYTDLEEIAGKLGHEVVDFSMEHPPRSKLGPYDDLWKRRRLHDRLTTEQKAMLQAIEDERDQKIAKAFSSTFAVEKKAQLQKAKARKVKR